MQGYRGHFLLTVDVEDWFQVENLRPWNPRSAWDSKELRVEENTQRILDLLDSFSPNSPPGSGDSRVQDANLGSKPSVPLVATFFMLGWVARRLPGLVREIAARGHEVASHGYSHDMCTSLSQDQLRQDLDRSKKLLEDILGAPVKGYRAPNFSVTPNVLEVVRQCGYRYDSSYNSFSFNTRYGRMDFSKLPRIGSAFRLEHDFYEIPISNLPFYGRTLPMGGGGYFRLLPWLLFRAGIRRILEQQGAYMFYFHPWEIDPRQPRIGKRLGRSGLKHYMNLARTEKRLRHMFQDFAACRFVTCSQYLSSDPGPEQP